MLLEEFGTPPESKHTHIVLIGRCILDFHTGGSLVDQALERRDFVGRFHTGTHAARLGTGFRVASDDSDLLDILADRQHTAVVLEQDDGALGHFIGSRPAFGRGSRLEIAFVGRDGLNGVTHAENLPHFVVHNRFRHLSGLDRVDQGGAEIRIARHLHVESVERSTHRRMGSTPVGDRETFEAPLPAKDLVEQMLVLRAVETGDLVVGRHDGHGAAFPYDGLERLEIDLAHRTLVDDHVHAAAVHLLVVEGEVLHAGGRSGILDTLHIADAERGGQHGVFAEVFIGTSADREALDVDGRTEDDVLAAATGFRAHPHAILVGKILRPGGCEGRSGREIRGRVGGPAGRGESIGNAFLTDAERTVAVLDVLDTQTRHTFRRHIGLAVEHFDLLFKRHLRDDRIDFAVVGGQSVLRQGVGCTPRQQDAK